VSRAVPALLALLASATMVAAPARAIEARLELDRLVVTEEIVEDDDFKLLSALVEHRARVKVVHFHAMPGGDMTAALRMGTIIRSRGLDTIATVGCMSACAFAFLGGVNRRLAIENTTSPPFLALHGPVDSQDPDVALAPSHLDRIFSYATEMTAGRAARPVMERMMALKLHNFVYFVAVPRPRRPTETGALECQSIKPPANAEEMVRDCRPAPDLGALELGLVTTNFVYRLAPGTPYRRP